MRKRLPLLAVLLFFGMLAIGQNTRKITGQVKDDASPVPFATITETNTNHSATSDVNGNFSITIKGNQITISAVDHASQTITFSKQVFRLQSGVNACPKKGTFTAAFGPVLDTSVHGRPHVFVN